MALRRLPPQLLKYPLARRRMTRTMIKEKGRVLQMQELLKVRNRLFLALGSSG